MQPGYGSPNRLSAVLDYVLSFELQTPAGLDQTATGRQLRMSMTVLMNAN